MIGEVAMSTFAEAGHTPSPPARTRRAAGDVAEPLELRHELRDFDRFPMARGS